MKKPSKKNKPRGFFEQVYDIVQSIPKGKVMTYGQIGKTLNTKDARKVGWALHANTSKAVPCHRVVNKQGYLAKNFAFNGEEEQKRRLVKEGVCFTNNYQVNLDDYKCK